MNKNKLHFELKNYLIDNSFKHGDNFTYNAPQVFEVKCMQNANFVVQVYLKNGKKFRDSKSILAKAQIQGRTIILNLQTQNIVYEQKLFEVYSSSGAYNIVPVLAHELGHCFGLRHDTSGISIMAATTKSIAKFPTSNDGLKFAQTLAMKIQGSQPGYFNPTHCIGLRSN
jgi:hypothetical protein